MPAGEPAHDASLRHSEVEREDCCEVERSPSNVSPAVAPPTDDGDTHIASVGWVPTPDVGGALAGTTLALALARGPPQAIGPPTYLRNCHFLI